MKKIELIEFISQVPNPAKGVQARSYFSQALQFEEGVLEIYRKDEGEVVLIAPAKRTFGVPWNNVKFVDYGPETSETSSSRSGEETRETDEPGPGRDSVRPSKGVRTRPKQK